MQNPDRLVLDFSGARLAVDKTIIPGRCGTCSRSASGPVPAKHSARSGGPDGGVTVSDLSRRCGRAGLFSTPSPRRRALRSLVAQTVIAQADPTAQAHSRTNHRHRFPCEVHAQNLPDSRSPLRVAWRTDPALSHPGIIWRKGFCSERGKSTGSSPGSGPAINRCSQHLGSLFRAGAAAASGACNSSDERKVHWRTDLREFKGC